MELRRDRCGTLSNHATPAIEGERGRVAVAASGETSVGDVRSYPNAYLGAKEGSEKERSCSGAIPVCSKSMPCALEVGGDLAALFFRVLFDVAVGDVLW